MAIDCAVMDVGRRAVENNHAVRGRQRPTGRRPPRRPLPLVHLEVADGVVYATGFEHRTI
jgi:hypothetical protein